MIKSQIMTNEQTAVRATYFSIIGNTCLAFIKGLAGFFGNSYAMIADAIESTTDIFSSLLVLFSVFSKERDFPFFSFEVISLVNHKNKGG